MVTGYTLDDVECRMIESRVLIHRMRLTIAPSRERPVQLLVVLDPFLWLPAIITFVRALDQLEHAIPATTVVGVEHDTYGDHHAYWSRRARDFTPSQGTMPNTISTLPLLDGTGHAADFTAHLSNEVLPAVAGTRPEPEHRIVMGWSLSGLFTLATTIHAPAPGLFTRHIAVSPSLFWAGGALLADAETTRPSSDRIYLVAGAREEPETPLEDSQLVEDTRMITNLHRFAAQCRPDAVRIDIAPDAHHFTSGHHTLHRAIASTLAEGSR